MDLLVLIAPSWTPIELVRSFGRRVFFFVSVSIFFFALSILCCGRKTKEEGAGQQ